MLIELVDILVGQLAAVLNQKNKKSDIPAYWKLVWVLPVFKKGSNNKAVNYQLISLTPIMCKLMGTFVKESIMEHLVSENLLSNRQFRFMLGRSTVTQLLQYLDNVSIRYQLIVLLMSYTYTSKKLFTPFLTLQIT